MKRTYSFYRPESGELLSRRVTCDEESVARNTPAGTLPVEGHYDWRTQRVAVEQLPAGDNPRRYVVLRAEPAPDPRPAKFVQMAIRAEERKQLRAMRELLLDPDNADAKARVEAIETTIATQLRPKLSPTPAPDEELVVAPTPPA